MQDEEESVWTGTTKAVVFLILGLWFLLAYWMGVSGAWIAPVGAPFRPVLTGLIAPLIIFGNFYWFSAKFRAFVRGQNIEALTAIQLWRVLGASFLFLYVFGELPRVFAFAAGGGDLLVGILALPVLLKLRKDPAFLASNWFLGFNILGLLDFAGAVMTSRIGETTGNAMQVWPLSIIITFLVPLFIMAHVASLIAWRRAMGAKRSL